ncbi:MAG: NAD(+) diphosphatase [Polyangiaceae bacterium]|nr:NAD(+) diphosphatase [Myxococcales bacterium]MCB9583850.1 NAD(+) diphosphatase [Polyangiaceae bacterium]MCB9607894.1 NAD(+) diphosphatase [Polyangiaceae bacterium]
MSEWELDRAGLERNASERLESALDAPNTDFVVQWRGRVLVQDSQARVETGKTSLVDAASEIVWLGKLTRDGEARDCFVVDVSPVDEPKQVLGLSGSFADLRLLGDLPTSHFGLLAYARGMLAWHENHPFCAKCGVATRPKKAGHTRICPEGHEHFPRTDPAVMILATRGARCLIARQPGFPQGMFSALAGFVEPGESLEDTVRREALEEVGLEVTNPRYFRSQAWPFPASLMLGFVVDAASDAFRLDDDELEEARWVSRSELAKPEGFFTPPASSLAHHLLGAFARGEV